jgi:hypothetical protein
MTHPVSNLIDGLIDKLGETRIARFAWAMAWFALIGGQLHALARHNTEDGKADLDLPLTAAWSDPARKALAPLLEWSTPDQVYLTYGKLWLPVFVAFTLAAFVVRRHRSPYGLEKWAWRITLTGCVWGCLSVFGDYWLQWGKTAQEPLLTITFVFGLPAVLLLMVGSTVLGIALLRRGFRPRLSAWLLTLTLPGLFAITMVTSMGSITLPVAFAFAIAARHLQTVGDHRVEDLDSGTPRVGAHLNP